MEVEGLSRALEFLDANALEFGALITDRHKQICKFVSKHYPDIEDLFDVWHVSSFCI